LAISLVGPALARYDQSSPGTHESSSPPSCHFFFGFFAPELLRSLIVFSSSSVKP